MRSFDPGDGVPRVYPTPFAIEKYRDIVVGDQTKSGDAFWEAMELTGSTPHSMTMRERLLDLWTISKFAERGIVFDPEKKIVDGIKASRLVKLPGGSYMSSVFISTPTLNKAISGVLFMRALSHPKYQEEMETWEPREYAITPSQKKALVPAQAVGTKRPGCSNAAKHAREGLAPEDFCGPAGGSCATSFPVNTPGRAKSALGRAHFAPNPQGIHDCACAKAEREGWFHCRK